MLDQQNRIVGFQIILRYFLRMVEDETKDISTLVQP
jgi:hypothetical protein